MVKKPTRIVSKGLFLVIIGMLIAIVFSAAVSLSAMPVSAAVIADNTYVKSASGPEVYVVEGGKLRHLKNEDAYRWYKSECFIRFDRTEQKSVLDSIGYGAQVVAPPSYTACPSSGTLVKSICLPNVYLFENGQFKWIEDEFTFNARGYNWGDIVTISERFIPEYNKASECGSLGASIKIVDSITDPLPRRDLYDFGFGQAVVMDGVPKPASFDGEGLFAADDLALTVPAVANLANSKVNFPTHAGLAKEASLLYNSVPQTILNLKTYSDDDFTQSFANLNKYLENGGVAHFDDSDLAGLYGPWDRVYSEGSRYHWLNLNQESTRNKASALLKSELAVHSAAKGVFFDNIDASDGVSFAYPDRLHETIRAFLGGQSVRPLVGANLFSVKLHAANGYKVFSPDFFDVVMVEEYGINDKVVDVVNFHRKFPNTAIIVNAKYASLDKSLFGASTAEKKNAREVVVVAALVGGLHSIDGGAVGHGNNTIAHKNLNYPFFRAGRPVSDLQDKPAFFKRDYNDMIAIYAKANADVYVRGRWTDFWTKKTYENGLPIVAGESYLLFRESLVAGAGVVESAGVIVEDGEENSPANNNTGNSTDDNQDGNQSNETGIVDGPVDNSGNPWGVENVPVEEKNTFVPNNQSFLFGDGSSCNTPRELVEGVEQKKMLTYSGESVWYQLNVSQKKIAYFSLKGLQFGRFALEIYNNCEGELSAVTKWQDTSEFRYYQVSPAEGTYFVRVVKENYDNPGKEFSLVANSALIQDQIDLQVVDFFVAGKDMADDSNVLEVFLRNNGRSFDHMANVGAFANGSLLGWTNVYGLRANETKRVRLVATSSPGEKVVTVGNGAGGYGWQLATQDPDNTNDNRTKNVTFETARHDVAIVSLSAQGGVPYQSSTITYTVRNRGNLREPFFVSSSQVVGGAGTAKMHYDLYPGAEVAVSYSWMSYTEGNFSVVAQVDENDLVAELNENNNRLEKVVEWKYPRQVVPEVVHPIVNETIELNDTVEVNETVVLNETESVVPRGNGTLVIVNESVDASVSGVTNETANAGKMISDVVAQSPIINRGSSGGRSYASKASEFVEREIALAISDVVESGAYASLFEGFGTSIYVPDVQSSEELPVAQVEVAPLSVGVSESAVNLQVGGQQKVSEESKANKLVQSTVSLSRGVLNTPAVVVVLTVLLGLGVWKFGRFDELM